jgi:hypothetical protein
MNKKNDKTALEQGESRPSLLAQFAGALLLAAALFALAAIVALGSQGWRSDWGWGFVILGVLCLLGWFVGRRKVAKAERIAGDQYSRQRAVLGINAIVSVLLFLVLMVGINYIAARRHKVFDFTKNRINSLAPQTYKALGNLKAPLTLTYVWAASREMPQPDASAQSVLEAYKGASDKIKVEYFNAVENPLRLQQMGLSTFTGQPLLVIAPQSKGEEAAKPSTPGARQEVTVVDEQNITSAILKINDAKQRVLYFLAGHGELSAAAAGMGGVGGAMNAARAALEAQNYALKNLSLLGSKASIPSDAAALVAVGPQVDLSTAEETKLKQYIARQGRLLLLMQIPRTPLPRWKSLLATMNVEMLDGQVLEFDRDRAINPQIIVGTLDPNAHALLRGVSGAVVFPGVVPLKARPAAPGAANAPLVTPLFQSSEESEIVTVRGGSLQRGAKGPYALALAVETSSAPGGEGLAAGLRAVVVGNGSFCTDSAFGQYGNTSFFLSAVNWVVGNDALVSIPPKEPVTNSISMTTATQRFAVLFSLFTLPILLLLIGTVIWWKRR